MVTPCLSLRYRLVSGLTVAGSVLDVNHPWRCRIVDRLQPAATLVVNALGMAVETRPLPGLIHHGGTSPQWLL